MPFVFPSRRGLSGQVCVHTRTPHTSPSSRPVVTLRTTHTHAPKTTQEEEGEPTFAERGFGSTARGPLTHNAYTHNAPPELWLYLPFGTSEQERACVRETPSFEKKGTTSTEKRFCAYIWWPCKTASWCSSRVVVVTRALAVLRRAVVVAVVPSESENERENGTCRAAHNKTRTQTNSHRSGTVLVAGWRWKFHFCFQFSIAAAAASAY